MGCSPAKWPRYLRVALSPDPHIPTPANPSTSELPRQPLLVSPFFFSPSSRLPGLPASILTFLRPSVHPPEDTTTYYLQRHQRSSETETVTAVPSFRQFTLFGFQPPPSPCALLAVLFVRASLHKKTRAGISPSRDKRKPSPLKPLSSCLVATVRVSEFPPRCTSNGPLGV